jgi:Xaa-Pro aminopeptidase
MVARQSEIIANVQRLHEHMDRAGCAALVVRSGKNVTYLAGFAYPGTLARHLNFPDSPREVLLVWPPPPRARAHRQPLRRPSGPTGLLAPASRNL